MLHRVPFVMPAIAQRATAETHRAPRRTGASVYGPCLTTPSPQRHSNHRHEGLTLFELLLLGVWLQAGWSVSEKFSYQQNFPAKNSEARRRWLPPIQFPPPGKARPSATVFRLIKPPTAGRKILWVGRFPQPQAAGPRIRQSFRLKAGLRTRKIGLVSLR